ncbi:molybdenum cofactor guanylyltransferase [Nonomuraea sp. NPDC046570]|uniref:molybdenum cofactor guanylyltransferase n=1 Tax=Nonomuraea sp. NPDC046570 TaxID=3155255 RepID=UPI0033DCCAAC
MVGVEYDAIILAGGEARRLGGRDKPGLQVRGKPLVELVAAAVPQAARLVVVGPPRNLPGAITTREDPPGGGPVPALRAGLAEVTAPYVALLAGDLPFLRPEHVAALLRAAAGEDAPVRGGSAAGAVLVDDSGQAQWLAGVWRTAALRAALAGYAGRSLRGVLAPLEPVRLALPGEPWFDCDTMDDLRQARQGEPG